MPTPAQIDEQIQLEREQISQGLKRLQDNTKNLESKDYASASVYGVASIDTLLPLVIQRIEETNQRIHERKNGVAFREIHSHLADIEPEAAAAISCKIVFDKVFSYKQDNSKLARVAEAIGRAIEDECQMRHYEQNAPGLLETLKSNYWHRSCGTHQKIKVISVLMGRYDVKQWKPWGSVLRVKLGTWLLECVMQASNWFMLDNRREGKKTTNFVVPTPEFMAIKDQVMANAELFSPLAWPMLIEPNPWENGRAGGYLLNEVMRGHDLVRRGSNTAPIQGETPINFVNHIQKIPFTLSPFIVRVAEELQEKGYAVGKFLPVVHHELPPKPVDIAENAESRKDYRRRAAEVMNLNAQEFKKSCRTRMTMEAVARFKNISKFYIPWSFDYRGRAYPIPAFLTPQDTDFGKSLLRFYEEGFLTPESEEWLAFQVATTYGLDKAPMNERMEWVKDNQELITRIATDPIGNIHEWEAADEPWTFLAACEEYYYCLIDCSRSYTSLPIAVDATCSGLQIMAGLAKDASTAAMVNVLPGCKPQDAYRAVAEACIDEIPERLRPYWDRKKTKRSVMTICYNAKPYSNRQYIRDAFKEAGIEVDKDELTLIVKAVRKAMNTVFPGPMAVMKWIEDEVAAAIKDGAEELSWCTPSGFVVTQRLMKPKVKRVDLQLMGTVKVRVADGYTDEVDIKHHKNATAPNLIHSLDASLLHLSALRFNAPLALIHDSVLCRSCDMATLSTIVRETYMHLFAEHEYLTSFAKQIGAKTKPPIIGDLEPESVIESTYFFC